jgi:hypothetical protein
MGISLTWGGAADNLEDTLTNIKNQIADSITAALGDELEQIQREAYELTPYDPNNPHTGTEGLKITTPRIHKGTSIPPADLHLKRGSGEDTGHLRDTAVVDILYDEDIDVIAGQISYNSPYAVYQHEDLALNHPNGGEAKYLETPWLGHQTSLLEEIGQRIVDDSANSN